MRKKRNHYRKFLHSMGIVFFAVLLMVILLNLITPVRKFSAKENRVLASRPKADLSQIANGGFGKSYETYVNDQFFLRDAWVTLKAGADRLLGRVEGNGVYLGRDGYLMEMFTPPSQEQFATTANAMTAFAAEHPDLKQYALIAPNAVNILKDKLPAFAPAPDQNEYLDQLKASLENGGITFIDTREALRSHKNEGIYYRTDHHWTTQGAYLAYLTMAPVMGLATDSMDYDKLIVSNSFQGTLSAKSGFRSSEKDDLYVYLPKGDAPSSVINYVDEQRKSASFYSTAQLEGRDKYALFFDGNHPKIKISTPVEENRNLLVLKDSYANCLVPFLAPHYRNIIMVDPRYYYDDLNELIQVENIQEVLYLYNANTFFADTSLEMVLEGESQS